MSDNDSLKGLFFRHFVRTMDKPESIAGNLKSLHKRDLNIQRG